MENTDDGHRLQLPYPQSFGVETHQSLEMYGLHKETPLVCMPLSGAKTPFSDLTVTEPFNGPDTFDISSLFSPDPKPVPEDTNPSIKSTDPILDPDTLFFGYLDPSHPYSFDANCQKY
ncbi:hypothetical protein F2Q69_00021166 [Brassica cretica]|uniref:Uncharacterized protein n=1 Tax=Brassica cretica TaxID=69181 RepID=A0A8S9QTS2_BRACR|nr:hypothetical protein F2Q69_00021166 [Brassica cretica]